LTIQRPRVPLGETAMKMASAFETNSLRELDRHRRPLAKGANEDEPLGDA
jgi:hypothetical protein